MRVHILEISPILPSMYEMMIREAAESILQEAVGLDTTNVVEIRRVQNRAEDAIRSALHFHPFHYSLSISGNRFLFSWHYWKDVPGYIERPD